MKTIIFFDCESTGLNTTTDRIIQLSLIKTDIQFNILEKKKLLLSNCGVPIHPKAFEAHGISEQDLAGKFEFKQYATKIFEYLESSDYIAGYNIKGFDIPLLYEEFVRCGIIWNPKPIIDCCVIFKNREKRNLEHALKFYCGKELDGAHDAENDVIATIEVCKGQIEMYSLDKYIRLIGESENVINQEQVPVENTLVSESKYPDEDNRLSWDGKIVLNSENVPVWGFGKFKDKQLKDADLGYINWFLNSDFSNQSKNILRSLLNKWFSKKNS